MKINRIIKGTLALVLVFGLAGAAYAQGPKVDYLGFAWEDGGFPSSNPGDVFNFLGEATAADLIFGVDLGSTELTFIMSDLVSTGDVPLGGGTSMVAYVGGTLEIYADGAQNADYGTNPPSPTAPGTFNDGTLFFRGEFTDFSIFINAAGAGAFEGNLDGIAGTVISDVCTGCIYTWGGTFTTDTGAQIPAGYDMQVDGIFEIEAAVPTETSSWGGVKSLYR